MAVKEVSSSVVADVLALLATADAGSFEADQAKTDMSYLVNVFSALGSCPGLGIMAHAVWALEGGRTEGGGRDDVVEAVERVCERLRGA